jgi:hypothetical protein
LIWEKLKAKKVPNHTRGSFHEFLSLYFNWPIMATEVR